VETWLISQCTIEASPSPNPSLLLYPCTTESGSGDIDVIRLVSIILFCLLSLSISSARAPNISASGPICNSQLLSVAFRLKVLQFTHFVKQKTKSFTATRCFFWALNALTVLPRCRNITAFEWPLCNREREKRVGRYRRQEIL